MSLRKRFTSTWSSAALLIFFADIFIDVKLFGYSGILVAIVMWITGGAIATILFGPEIKRKARSRKKVTETKRTSENVQFCTACGTSYEIGSQYCPECGTASLSFVQSKDETGNKGYNLN